MNYYFCASTFKGDSGFETNLKKPHNRYEAIV
jgi:hypothetical protein